MLQPAMGVSDMLPVATLRLSPRKPAKIQPEPIDMLPKTQFTTWAQSAMNIAPPSPPPTNRSRKQSNETPTMRRKTSSKSSNDLCTKSFAMAPRFNQIVALFSGDITTLKVDAIVNSANSELSPGGGASGCIHAAAGPELAAECAKLAPCEVGDAKLTNGHCLHAKYVIHTVGPKHESPHILASCYVQLLNLCLKHNIKTVAIPCISTGTYSYDNNRAARAALQTVREWLDTENNHRRISNIIFCLYTEIDREAYYGNLAEFFPLESTATSPRHDSDRSLDGKVPNRKKKSLFGFF